MKTLLITLLALASTPALATTFTVSLDCKPSAPFGEPMRAEWDSLLAVKSLNLTTRVANPQQPETSVEIAWKMHSGFENKELEVTERFDYAQWNGLLTPKANIGSLRFTVAALTVTKIDMPFTPGPVPPGAYPAQAVLTLVSNYREQPGDDLLKVATRQVDLSCIYRAGF